MNNSYISQNPLLNNISLNPLIPIYFNRSKFRHKNTGYYPAAKVKKFNGTALDLDK